MLSSATPHHGVPSFDFEPSALRANALYAALARCRESRMSARLSIRLGPAPVGQVVVLSGRVGWAVSIDQQQDLGTFLWRLGKVRRSDITAVRQRFVELEGRRKFGALLEEAGLLKRPVLRRCLLLHTRAALNQLFRAEALEVDVEPIAIEADGELTFEFEEVMRTSREPEDSPNCLDFGSWTSENAVLAPLREVPGYRACALLSAEGEVLVAQSSTTDFSPPLIAVFSATVLEHSLHTVSSAGVGAVKSALLECDEGTVIARWVGSGHQYLLALLIDPTANLGMATLRIAELLPSLETFVATKEVGSNGNA
jgi:predicted regulator of Ras-like GTPase activity (Roadblock/LC7/MglB family)